MITIQNNKNKRIYLKTIYNDIHDEHKIVIYKRCKLKNQSLRNYKMLIDTVDIEFYISDKTFAGLYPATVNNNNNGGWKTFYSALLKVSIEVLTFAEHIIYQDLYKAEDDIPKVVYNEYKHKYYIAKNYWFYAEIELPEVFIEHFPQYKWML